MKICFSGAHRTGKTTLAERIALENDLVMYYTEVGKILKDRPVKYFEELSGKDGFYERLALQENILSHIVKKISEGEEFSVFDRSVLDVYAYSELFLSNLLRQYKPTQSDIELFNEHLSLIKEQFKNIDFIFILQPGIEFEDCEDSGSRETQEELNEIFLNIADLYIPKDKYFVMPRSIVNLEERVDICQEVLKEKLAVEW